MKCYTGTEFNKIYKNVSFYKILNEKLNHRGFQYKAGLNTDIKEVSEFTKYGLYFTNSKNICYFLYLGCNIAQVFIPNNTTVYIQSNSIKVSNFLTFVYDLTFKAKKIILKNITLLYKFDKWDNYAFCLNAVEQNGMALEYIKHSEYSSNEETTSSEDLSKEQKYYKLCRLAVSNNGLALYYVNEPSYELCKIAVKQNGNAINHIINPIYELCKLAVEQNGCVTILFF